MPLPLDLHERVIEERTLGGPTVLAAQDVCPAAADLTHVRARAVLDVVVRGGITVEPRRVAEARFCRVWFVLKQRGSMWLRGDDDDLRRDATSAKDFFDAHQTAEGNEAERAEAHYLAGVMQLVLDPYVGERRMIDFTRQFPNSPLIQDAWLWIADREASGCGGAW